MFITQKVLWVFVCLLGFAQGSLAETHDDLPINGLASYSKANDEYYQAALFIAQPDDSEAVAIYTPMLKRMEIRITADKWRKRSFATYWNQAIIINNSEDLQKSLANDIQQFVNLPVDSLEYGDRIVIDYTPDKGTVIYLNDKKALTISKDAFFGALVSAWVGNIPPSTEFKSALLAKKVSADKLKAFQSIEPEDKATRYSITASWY